MVNGISGEALIAIEWLLISIAFVLILARINLRILHHKQGLVISDYFIFGAFVSAIGLGAVDIMLYRHGIYQPQIDFKLEQYIPKSETVQVEVYKIFYGLYFPFYLEQYFNKGTLIALYWEIFSDGSAKIRRSLYSLSVYVGACFITTMLMITVHCKMGCYWSFTEPCANSCMRLNDNLCWALHFTCDILIFVFPLACISRLNMTRAQKISASITFCIGFINISVTIARWFVVQALFTPVPSLTTGEALAIADGHTGLIVAILPSLRPYLRIWHPHLETLRAKFSSKSSQETAEKGLFTRKYSGSPRASEQS